MARGGQRANQEASVNRRIEVGGGVDRPYLGGGQSEVIFPGVDENLAGHGGLTEHRKGGSAVLKRFQQLDRHPLRDVEVALAGEGVQADTVLEGRLRRQVLAAQDAKL